MIWSDDMIQKKDIYSLVIPIWVIFLICLTAIASYAIYSMIERHDTAYDHTNSNLITVSSNDTPFRTDVLFGTYITRIYRLSMKESNFDVDFYIWFKWKGNNVAPGETIEIINGKINSKELQAELHENDTNYEQYQISASIIQPFDVIRYPFDNHNLIIKVEDCLSSIYWLQYFPENTRNPSVNEEIYIPGYRSKYLTPTVEINTYQTDFGSPWQDQMPSTYSQIKLGIGLVREGWGFYLKLFQGLFVAVAVAMIAFTLRPNYAPRFIVGVGALFAAVANYYNILYLQPAVNYMTLADIINFTGIITIFLSMVGSSISYYLYDFKRYVILSRRFDKFSVITFVFCFIFVNCWIVWVGNH